jgi:hemerythrin-like domain-containing protein
MEPLEILEREHRMVSLVADAARRDVDRALETGAADTEEIGELIEFFRYFTNSCHAPKEEDLLFTMLHRRGLAWDASPLCDLVREHEEMRVLLDSASDWLAPVAAGEAGGLPPLLHDLATYLDLLKRHIATEEEVVFPLAQERLTAHDIAELGKEFSAIACDELDEGIHAYYAEVAYSLAGAAA